jgi:hypothetical protein
VLNWLKNFFGSTDRVQVAGDRMATAAEEMAQMMERARDEFRARLGIEAPAPVVVAALPAAEGEPKKGRGKG